MIGLVGGIGAGKSQAAQIFEQLGSLVLDADTIGHAHLDQKPAREQVLRRFGPDILTDVAAADSPPRVDRRKLGSIVFADAAARRDLEAILHPRMFGTFERAIQRAQRTGRVKAVVLDAAILFEAGWDRLCDVVVFVDAPREQRLARLNASRGWSSSTLDAREAAQMSLDEKRRRADVVVPNTGTIEALEKAIRHVWANCFARSRNPAGRSGPGAREATRTESTSR